MGLEIKVTKFVLPPMMKETKVDPEEYAQWCKGKTDEEIKASGCDFYGATIKLASVEGKK